MLQCNVKVKEAGVGPILKGKSRCLWWIHHTVAPVVLQCSRFRAAYRDIWPIFRMIGIMFCH